MITNLWTKEVSANVIFGSIEFIDAVGQPKTTKCYGNSWTIIIVNWNYCSNYWRDIIAKG